MTWDAFEKAIRENTSLDQDQLVVISYAHDLRLSSIHDGILFLFAQWSGPAHIAFRTVKEALTRFDLGVLKLTVADVDGLGEGPLVRELMPYGLGGYGEAFWIRAGKVESFVRHPDQQPELVEEYTRRLLWWARVCKTTAHDQPRE
jgi:hypothetical protein